MLDERQHFARLLEALEQHLDALIVVGGWATRLYRLHDDVSQVDFSPLTTADADFVLPEALSTAGIDINDALSNAGFEERMWGDETPPVTHYVASDGGFEIEFITHKKGGLETRAGRNVTASIGGVTAQRLGNVRILELEPWSVTVRPEHGFPVRSQGISVKIPNPTSFIAQKLLAIKRRGRKQPKDVLYIHDTLHLFRDELSSLNAIWTRISPFLGDSITSKISSRWAYVTSTPRALQLAARIAVDSGRPAPPSPDDIREVCAYGISQIFDKDEPHRGP